MLGKRVLAREIVSRALAIVAQVDSNKSVIQCHIVALRMPDAANRDETMNKDREVATCVPHECARRKRLRTRCATGLCRPDPSHAPGAHTAPGPHSHDGCSKSR